MFDFKYLFEKRNIPIEEMRKEMSQIKDFKDRKKFIDIPKYNFYGLFNERMIYFNNKLKEDYYNKYSKDNNIINSFLENGYYVVENILDDEIFKKIEKDILKNKKKNKYSICIKDKKIVDILNLILCQNLKNYDFYKKYLTYSENYDEQRNLHSDAVFSRFKIWFYINDINEENGAFQYVKGSNNINDKKLDFFYNVSNLDIKDTRLNNHCENSSKGSIRIFKNNVHTENEIMNEMRFSKPISMNFKKNTLIVSNTHGFHKRGFCQKGKERIMLQHVF